MDFQTRYQFDPKKDLLGKGGFSKVYRANDILLERTVALKFFTAKTAEKYQVLNEIKRVIRFEHPNLCKYYDVALLSYKNVLDETEQMEVGIMEYIDAGDFKSYLKKHPQYTDKLLIDVLKGLAYLHKHGIAHRDLKPQNILIKIVDDEPVSKITDFGISKIIDAEDGNSSALLGTIEYMAPEQFNPKKYGINGRIATNLDLWSFGILVYEAICQQSLFGSRSTGISAEQVMSNILSDIPLEKAELLPPKYREIVKRCLVKNAAERVQNALLLIPLFQEESTMEGVVPLRQQTDSGSINVAEAQVLGPALVEKNDEPFEDDEVTQTVNPMPEPDLIETSMFDKTPELTAEETIEDPQPPEPEMEETSVLQPVAVTSEVTQALPQLSSKADETGVLVSEPLEEEEQTQVITPNIARPVVEERVQRKPPKKPVNKIIVLAVAAVVLIGSVVVFSLSKKTGVDQPPPPPPPPQETVSQQPEPPLLKPETVTVAGGSFLMGDESGRDPAAPVHNVTLSSFEIGKYEVTIEQFRQFISDTKYETTAEKKGTSAVFVNGRWDFTVRNVNWRHDAYGREIDSSVKSVPVVHVSWADADAYCKWLSDKTGETYRLPTEAQWEFAARGGDSVERFVFSGSNNLKDVGWYDKNSDVAVHEVGKKKPNALGIYDMSGNAAEWCYDYYMKDYYRQSPSENPVNTTGDNLRVNRGGASGGGEMYCRNTNRFYFKEDLTGGNIGFRVCKIKQ